MGNDVKPDASVVRTAGRGVLYITFAKLWFMATGWALIFVLPRIFKWASGGDPAAGQALFGEYKLVVMGVSFINNGIITGTIQAVSKFTSEDETRAGAVQRAALKVQAAMGAVLAGLYIAFAGFLADTLGSPDLAFLMRLSAGIIVAYSCYAVFIGSFNGRRLFNRQALFDITYSTIKTGLILVLAAAGFQVLGTVLGFLIASVVIALLAAVFARWGGEGAFPARRYFSFAAVLIVYTFLLNLVMSLDLFLLKGVSSHLAVARGDGAEAASAASKALAGSYGAAQGLAFIPYQAILSIAFVVFPMVSKVTFSDEADKARAYVRKALRFALIFIVAFAAVFTALPGQCLGLIFPPEYCAAADALGILSIGISAFGVMVVSNTILNGAGLPGRAMAVVGLTLAAVTAAVCGFLFAVGPGGDPLAATALGSTIGMAFGLAISAMAVYRRFGTFCPLGTVVRVAAAAGVAVALGRCLPDAGKLFTLFECGLIVVVYFGVLALTREFGKEDVDQLRTVLCRRG